MASVATVRHAGANGQGLTNVLAINLDPRVAQQIVVIHCVRYCLFHFGTCCVITEELKPHDMQLRAFFYEKDGNPWERALSRWAEDVESIA